MGAFQRFSSAARDRLTTGTPPTGGDTGVRASLGLLARLSASAPSSGSSLTGVALLRASFIHSLIVLPRFLIFAKSNVRQDLHH